MAPHSSTLAWKIPWTEEPGRLQSMGSLRVRHDWATSLSLFTFMQRRRKWQPTPVFLPGDSQGCGAAVYGVTQSRTWLKWLSNTELVDSIQIFILTCSISTERGVEVTSSVLQIYQFYFMDGKLWHQVHECLGCYVFLVNCETIVSILVIMFALKSTLSKIYTTTQPPFHQC